MVVYSGLAIFALSETGNFICHLMLRSLRPAEGSKVRPIPSGFLFDLVSCPNYTFEVAGWIGFSIMTEFSSLICSRSLDSFKCGNGP